MRAIFQVYQMFMVQCDNLREGQDLVSNSFTMSLQPGVTLVDQKMKATSLFRLDEDDEPEESYIVKRKRSNQEDDESI